MTNRVFFLHHFRCVVSPPVPPLRYVRRPASKYLLVAIIWLCCALWKNVVSLLLMLNDNTSKWCIWYWTIFSMLVVTFSLIEENFSKDVMTLSLIWANLSMFVMTLTLTWANLSISLILINLSKHIRVCDEFRLNLRKLVHVYDIFWF